MSLLQAATTQSIPKYTISKAEFRFSITICFDNGELTFQNNKGKHPSSRNPRAQGYYPVTEFLFLTGEGLALNKNQAPRYPFSAFENVPENKEKGNMIISVMELKGIV